MNKRCGFISSTLFVGLDPADDCYEEIWMSRTRFIEGIVPPDDDWRYMKAIVDACDKAGIGWPERVNDFFEGEKPDPAGMTIDLKEYCREWGDMDRDGFEIDVVDIPEKVNTIRVYETW